MRNQDEADYWMQRAEREKQRAKQCGSRADASFHMREAQRFLDIAFAEVRTYASR
jgi:hypothetical protein